MPETKIENTGSSMKLEQVPDGPLVQIDIDGTVKVSRGTNEEAAKLFWEAVQFAGKTYREQITDLQRAVHVLNLDPFRSIVHGGAYEVRKNMKHKIPLADVNHVLDTINDMAQRAIQ